MLSDVTDFCRLILLRHPQLDAAHGSVAVGGGAAPLSRRGMAHALIWTQLLQNVPIDAVWAADVPQSQQPADLLARAKGIEVAVDARLRDQSMGAWEGRPWDDIVRGEPDAVRDFFGDFGERRPPGGESLGEAVERMLGWWREQAAGYLGKTVAVVAAGSVVAGFVAAMLGMRLSRTPSLTLPHGALGIIDVYANGVKLIAWHPQALSDEVG